MASDLSSGCTDDIDIFEEKEEGELSLEDVSSSEESHPHYRPGYRTAGARCTNCMAFDICAPWCEAARAARKNHKKQDAVHGKENRRHAKDPSGAVPKHMVATLQEKNDDLVPISSDSDMEIVGLPGNSKQLHARSKSAKVRKKKKKKRSHSNSVRLDDSLSPSQVETYLVDVPVAKKPRASRSHHREPSPPRYSARSPLERAIPKSPSRRYRATHSLKLRSPQRRSRSPLPRVNPVERRSPRKLRSPRRSPAPRSPVRPTISRDSRDHALPTSPQNHIDIYATKLLQKVRRLESVGGDSPKDLAKSKEHSSLKEKLSNMMKNKAEASHEKPTIRKQINVNGIINNNNNNNSSNENPGPAESDDEDDLEVLRRLALETKQKKSEKKIEEPRTKSEHANVEDSDDNDIEANELRILALRSAIMKKHEKRVTRGVKSKRLAKSANRVESPFNESFLDDLNVSGEEDVKASTASLSPISHYESNHPEDMDIDTDVEREKEKDFMPYSPTDDLTREIVVMEVESIDTNGEINDEEEISSRREENATSERITSPENSDYAAGADAPYSPSAPIETPNSHKFACHDSPNNRNDREITENRLSSINSKSLREKARLSFYVPGVDTPFSPAGTLENSQSERNLGHEKNITELPYSPTDTPILDPHLFPIFPNLPAVVEPAMGSTEVTEESASSFSKIPEIDESVTADFATANEDKIGALISEEKNNLPPEKVDKSESFSVSDGNFRLPISNFRPIDIADKLPEVDLDGSPLVPVSKEHENLELVIPMEILPEIGDVPGSPEISYLQCLSDVSRDTNKIPTLVNRTLVPANILKTNKQLQQPLPQKKVENHAEPSFKSAEMRPVCVETTQLKLPTMFKPIKLCPIPKKPQVMTTMAAAAFNVSFGDDSMKETKSDEEIPSVDVPISIQEAKTPANNAPNFEKSQQIEEDSEQKKKATSRMKKRRRLRNKRKSSSVSASPSSESNRESLDNRAKNEHTNLINASGKKSKSSEFDERILRNSIKNSLVKSWDNFKDNVLKDENKTHREAPSVKSDEVTTRTKTGEVDGKKTKRRRGGRKVQQRKLASISRATRNKSSDFDTSADKSGENEQIETNKQQEEQSKAVEAAEKVEETERQRRCSIDEDEEALRAQLLASLPKRTKPVETGVSTPPENPATLIDLRLEKTSEISVENSPNKASIASSIDSRTPVNPLAFSTQSPSAIPAKIEAAKPENAEVPKKIIASKASSSSGEMSPRKRASSVVLRGPPKKIVKKALPVIASTKVVNNAKKYQNALIQKKLNLQRAAMNYAAQNGSRNLTLNNIKNNESVRPSSPKIFAASKTQRLVINLGSDSDSESDFESQTASQKSANRQDESRKPLAIPTTDFEKSVVQFLKDQRKKLESVVTISKAPANSTTTTSKTIANTASTAAEKLSGIYNTPLAVRRHLPMSQQEEYRRLKQQIADREREKLRKTIENGSSSQKSPCTPPGPLSPANSIAALQKPQIINKPPGVSNESSPINLAPPNKDKTAIAQKKIELVKANDNRSAINVTKASNVIVPAIPSKQITNQLASSSKINSSIPNIPASKAPLKIAPKANSSIENSKIAAITSTPKAQLISSKTRGSISSRVSLPRGKNAVSPVKKIGKFGSESASNTSKVSLESSTSLSTADKYSWSLGKTPVAALPSTASTSGCRSSLRPTEMLTIQIPNDKIQISERSALTGISRSQSTSPPNGRTVGMLKILTREQLNSRFVQIKVKQGTPGRTVTVGGSALSLDSATRSASSSPVSRIYSEIRSDKTDKKTCCDSSLIVNESNVRRRKSGSSEESMVADSEASTLVLSRNEGNNSTAHSEASTLIVNHEGHPHDYKNPDSEASTLVLDHDNSEDRGSPGLARTEESEDGCLPGNGGKQTKLQVKEVWEKIRSDVKSELEILTALPDDQQRNILIESQENLVAKRNMVLDDLTEMSGCLRQWEVEREIQTKLIAEVRRLREQLRTAEKHLHEQRRQMNGMGPKVTKAHEKINHGRRECYKLSRICHGLGTKLMGEEYKVPDTGAQLLNERLKEVAVHTRQLSKKKVPTIGSPNDSRDTNSPGSSTSSDALSEMSFAERPSNSTTPLLSSSSTSTENETNFSTKENDRIAEEKSDPPEKSAADSSASNPVSEEIQMATEKSEKTCERNSRSEEPTGSDSTEKNSQKKSNQASNSSETNAQLSDEEKSDPSKSDAQINAKNPSSSSRCDNNCNSDTPDVNFFHAERYQDISMPGTSKSHPRCELLAADDRPPVKSNVDPYKSVLTHFKASRSVNPDGILCPYELMGTCSDGDCQFYHLDPGHCQ